MSDTEWPRARLSELTLKIGSGSTPRGGSEAYKTSGVPLIRSMNVVFFGFKRRGLAYLDDAQADALRAVEVRENDVLLNITGASIGRVTRAPADMDGARVNQHVCIIRPNAAVDARFLSAYLSSPEVQSAITTENYGVTRQALTKEQILNFEIPLPPLQEQLRIADKLDSLLARVDAYRDRLDRVPPILKRFRQAVLAAATSGQLTEDWRSAQADAQLPWKVQSIGELIHGIDAGLNVKCDERPPGMGERGLVKISAVTWGRYNEMESKTLPDAAPIDERARIAVGDLLLSRANTLELVGACVIVDNVTLPLFLSDKVLRLRAPEHLRPWLMFVLRSPLGRQQIESMASGNQLSMRNLSQASLKSIRVPMPRADERSEVVRLVESLFALTDAVEARYHATRAHIDRLTPALLAKAFRGELVRRDPADEPVSELLARIAAQRATSSADRSAREPRQPRVPRAFKETAAMTKSRQDNDVKGQPYLASYLRRLGAPATAEALFKVAELPVADFYKQLAWEVARGHVKDRQTMLEPGHAAG